MNLTSQYREVRKYTLTLMEPLSVEDHLAQPVPEVSPPKWHLGHTTWFFENFILKKYLSGYQEFDPEFNYLFNSYYEGAGEHLLRENRGNMTRPPLEKVLDFRAYVDHYMTQLLESGTTSEINSVHTYDHMSGLESPVTRRASPKMRFGLAEKDEHNDVNGFNRQTLNNLIELGLNHEQQHQELILSDIKYILGTQHLHPAYRQEFKEGKEYHGSANWLKVDAGIYQIGYAGDGFCYDNELGRHKVYLEGFEICDRPVTNGDWLEFIHDGGYKNFQYWHSDGWTWVKENNIQAPMYWKLVDDKWQRYSLSGLSEVVKSETVAHISFYEAAAFAEWKGMRLPTEAEWEVAAANLDWGERWEWTNSAYLPYPGFIKARGAVGEYNGKFMVNQMVLRGASIATSAGHSRISYRNFFQPELRWQFTGLRLVKQ